MRQDPSGYPAALRTTLGSTAAAYGYTLAIASSAAMLTSVRGKPGEGELFLFIAGGLVAFALLDALLQLVRASGAESPQTAFPFAGALNFVSVAAGLGAATAVAHAIESGLAWFVAALVATATYMLVVAGQVTLVARLRRG